jgi:hypothetical protein
MARNLDHETGAGLDRTNIAASTMQGDDALINRLDMSSSDISQRRNNENFKPTNYDLQTLHIQEDKQKPDEFAALKAMPMDKVGDGLKDLAKTVDKFAAAPDKSAAFEKMQPQFMDAIQKTQSDYGLAVSQNWGDLNMARRDIMLSKGPAMQLAAQGLNEHMQTLSPEARAATTATMQLLSKPDLDPKLKDGLRKELQKDPVAAKAFDQITKAQTELKQAMDTLQKAQQPLLQKASEIGAAQFVMARAMELAGNKGEAALLRQQAQEDWQKKKSQITGEPFEPKPILKA